MNAVPFATSGMIGSAGALEHEPNMSLLGDGPSIVALLDQAKFLQPLAQRQGDESAIRDPAKGYLFLVGKFGLFETTRGDFHGVSFWRQTPGMRRCNRSRLTSAHIILAGRRCQWPGGK